MSPPLTLTRPLYTLVSALRPATTGPERPLGLAVHGRPTDHLVFGGRTASTKSTDLEDRVKAATLATVLKLWAGPAARETCRFVAMCDPPDQA